MIGPNQLIWHRFGTKNKNNFGFQELVPEAKLPTPKTHPRPIQPNPKVIQTKKETTQLNSTQLIQNQLNSNHPQPNPTHTRVLSSAFNGKFLIPFEACSSLPNLAERRKNWAPFHSTSEWRGCQWICFPGLLGTGMDLCVKGGTTNNTRVFRVYIYIYKYSVAFTCVNIQCVFNFYIFL